MFKGLNFILWKFKKRCLLLRVIRYMKDTYINVEIFIICYFKYKVILYLFVKYLIKKLIGYVLEFYVRNNEEKVK